MTYDEAVRNIGQLVIGNKKADIYNYTTEGTIWVLKAVINGYEIVVAFRSEKERMGWKNRMVKMLGHYPTEDEFTVDMGRFDLLRQNYYNTSKYGNNYRQKVAT